MPRVAADNANVARIVPRMRKHVLVSQRALERRDERAAAMTDAELEAELARNWTEGLGWEVTRRQKLAELETLRAAEPADDVAEAEAEIARERENPGRGNLR
jgi:hypothetical protein